MTPQSLTIRAELTESAGYSYQTPLRNQPNKIPCKYCGQKYRNGVTSVFCCLFAPEPTGWCAWCGDLVENKHRSFCTIPCANSFHADILENLKRHPSKGP